MKKARVLINKPVYLGLAILDISKILMYGFWYNYIELKNGDKARLCYMDTESFVIYIKTEDFYKDIADDVKGLIHLNMMKIIKGHFQLVKMKK